MRLNSACDCSPYASITRYSSSSGHAICNITCPAAGFTEHSALVTMTCAPDADDKPYDTSDDGQSVQVGQDYVARLGKVQFQPGTEVRRFLDVPEGASWAEMTLKAGNHDTPRY